MDIISHGLWGGIAFGRKGKRDFWTSCAFGVAPDLFSFGLFMGMVLLGLASGPDWSSGPPPAGAIPLYVHTLYDVTHSLIIFSVIFASVWVWRRKPYIPMSAWGLHILFDIPTHSTQFFPTPFLWPVWDGVYVDGVPWSHPCIFFPNIALLVVLYAYWLYSRRKRKKIPAT